MSRDGPGRRGSLDPNDAAFTEVVTDLLRRGHSVRFRAKGGSMRPTIREGEAITVAPARPGGIRRGDVILYRTERGVIAHRVADVAKRRDGALVFIPRSDASGSRDEAVGESAILGRVVAVERRGRRLDPSGGRARALAVVWAGVAAFLRRLRAGPRAG